MIKSIDHKSAKDFCAGGRLSSGRVHLPVAPRALARVRFSPEGPLPRALTLEQAQNWLDYLDGQGQSPKVVNINGPGDPLATPDLTLETLGMVRERYPQISMCLTTLGLGAGGLAEQLVGLGLAHVSLLVDAADAEVAQKIYAWIRPGTRTLPLAEAAELLVREQATAIADLARAGVRVLVKTTVYPGINSGQIAGIAQRAAELGAGQIKLFPFLTRGEDCPKPLEKAKPTDLEVLVSQASQYLPTQLVDVSACRDGFEYAPDDAAASRETLPKPSPQRPNLAVCSSDGFEVDLHLGQAEQYLIYGPQGGPVVLLGSRPAPDSGGGDARWQEVSLLLGDCFAILAAAAGEAPKRLLPQKGLEVLTQEGNIESLVDALYGGGKKKGAAK